jgi:hypothetical protein
MEREFRIGRDPELPTAATDGGRSGPCSIRTVSNLPPGRVRGFSRCGNQVTSMFRRDTDGVIVAACPVASAFRNGA